MSWLSPQTNHSWSSKRSVWLHVILMTFAASVCPCTLNFGILNLYKNVLKYVIICIRILFRRIVCLYIWGNSYRLHTWYLLIGFHQEISYKNYILGNSCHKPSTPHICGPWCNVTGSLPKQPVWGVCGHLYQYTSCNSVKIKTYFITPCLCSSGKGLNCLM